MKVVRLDMPVENKPNKRRRVRISSTVYEQKLHLEECERLDREIPLAGRKIRGFVFGAFN